MEAMPQWEDGLRATFGNRRVHVKDFKSNVVNFHKALEKATGETWKPKEKTLEAKILHVLDLAEAGSEWDAKAMQLHLFFFHKKTYSKTYIGKLLKKIADSGLLDVASKGLYVKVG